LIATGAVSSLDRHSSQHSHHVTGQFGWVGVWRKITFPLCSLKAATQCNFGTGAPRRCFLPNGAGRISDRQGPLEGADGTRPGLVAHA
jgi:hypothetical protein